MLHVLFSVLKIWYVWKAGENWSRWYHVLHQPTNTNTNIVCDSVVLPRGCSQQLYQCLRDKFVRVHLPPCICWRYLVMQNCLTDIPVLSRKINISWHINIQSYVFVMSYHVTHCGITNSSACLVRTVGFCRRLDKYKMSKKWQTFTQ